jgi:hypothetical protein
MGICLRLLMPVVAALLLLATPPLARAEVVGPNKQIPVDLELVLAVDVSRSVDQEEFDLQRQGYASALGDPRVLKAIRTGALGSIAITYFEWSGADQQRVIVPWTLVRSESDLEKIASDILAAPRPFAAYTSISGAIEFGLELMRSGPYEGTRQVIDISGDGPNNSGRSVENARLKAVELGVTINGLPIVNDRTNPFGRAEQNLDAYYKDWVIGGPGAFVIVAEGFQSFASAVLGKLIREVTSLPPEYQTMLAEMPPEL